MSNQSSDPREKYLEALAKKNQVDKSRKTSPGETSKNIGEQTLRKTKKMFRRKSG